MFIWFLFLDLPPGIYSLFISSATQQALQLCVDEDITQENNTKMIDKEVLLNDIQTNGQGSNFFEYQQQIQVCKIAINSSILIRSFIELSRKWNSNHLWLWLFLFTEFPYVKLF